MSKKNIDMVAIEVSKANAQNMTCAITFIATSALSIFLMLGACVLPAMVDVTEITCWISMTLEAASIGLGFIAYWIRKNTL